MSAIFVWNFTTPGAPPVGTLAFDVVTNETLSTKSRTTDKPVEAGANITDHVRPELDEVSLTVFVTNQPITAANNVGITQRGGIAQSLLSTSQYIPPSTLLSTIYDAARVYDAAIAGTLGAVAILSGLRKTISAPWQVQSLQFAAPFSATIETIACLRQLKDAKILVQVQARDWNSDSMMITSVTAPRTPDEGDGATIEIALKEIRVAQTRQTYAPLPTVPRALPTKEGAGGASTTAKAPGSVAAAAWDKLKGLIQ
jgi:hypothetical protein